MWKDELDKIFEETYAPKYDPKGQVSLALVVFMPNNFGSHLEVLASWGAGYDYADDCDGNSLRESWAQTLLENGFMDGLYVIEAAWNGGGEDSDFEVLEIRSLNQEEKNCISNHSEFHSVEGLWSLLWSLVPCAHCGEGYVAHRDRRASQFSALRCDPEKLPVLEPVALPIRSRNTT